LKTGKEIKRTKLGTRKVKKTERERGKSARILSFLKDGYRREEEGGKKRKRESNPGGAVAGLSTGGKTSARNASGAELARRSIINSSHIPVGPHFRNPVQEERKGG